MALKKSFEVSPGLMAQEAYFRVNNVNIVYGEPASATVHVYASSEHTGKPVQVRCYGFAHTLEGDNAIRQAYDHLKTLPEFAGATDC
jgi:hypothetical protein